MKSRFTSLPILCLILLATYCEAGDWPQILGPNRDGIAVDESLPAEFPAGGPRQVWSHSAGSGSSGAAIQGDDVILFHRQGDEELVECCAFDSGETRWTVRFPTNFRPVVGTSDGPLAVPVIHGDRVYVFGTSGFLAAINLQTGDLLWKKNVVSEFRAQEGYFGPGSTPLVVDDLLIANVGGFRTEAGMVAFERESGDVVWQATSEHASYASPMLYEAKGKKYILAIERLSTYLLDAKSGAVIDSIPFGQRGPTVNAANPVLMGNHFFLTASYGIGSVWGTISPDGLEIVWEDDEILASQYTTSIAYKDSLFAVNGRQDGGNPILCCINPTTRSTNWEEYYLGYATLIRVDDRLLHMNTSGTLRLLAADTSSYQELSKAELTRGTTRALPALSRGHLIIRNEDEFLCFKLTE